MLVEQLPGTATAVQASKSKAAWSGLQVVASGTATFLHSHSTVYPSSGLSSLTLYLAPPRLVDAIRLL